MTAVEEDVRQLLGSGDQEGAVLVARLTLDAHPANAAAQARLDPAKLHPVGELSDRQLFVDRTDQLLDR